VHGKQTLASIQAARSVSALVSTSRAKARTAALASLPLLGRLSQLRTVNGRMPAALRFFSAWTM